MIGALGSSWPLFLGMLLLMIGNGLQGTLLGIRGGIEGFSTIEMSVVMSAYFVGFLGGSRLAPILIQRVGHIRVFAALGSFISAILILYPTLTEPWAWILLRILIGFCFCGVYVTAESWLNDQATNQTRGMLLSIYMIVQMLGIVTAQYVLIFGDPSGFILFIVPSVLVSISFAPILLTVAPSPAFGTTTPMGFRRLFRSSPTGCVGMFLSGGVFAAMFGMSAVYGTLKGLSVTQISTFVASFYVGGLILQFPIGWISDRVDRRRVIMIVSALGGLSAALAVVFAGSFTALLIGGFMVGGLTNPLYALLLAYTNDYLQPEDMAGASGGLLFINGLGAILGPLALGVAMEAIGPRGFFLTISLLLLALAAYASWRATRRASISSDETAPYANVWAAATPVVLEVAQEVYAENVEEVGERPAAEATP
ncbi:MFS transporter [Roseitranquillus sediminis]|uniref:MFS transporter n=1 Tax=Roseitranquillus sediminis TaxID=2809051 RepID=UPI003873B325|nr:MFS transporter [Roseitranquillus sediminis]